MPVVTIAINKALDNRTNAWFQVVDDINNSNIDTIEYMIEKADLVKTDKFSIPLNMKEGLAENIYIARVKVSARQIATKLGFNETITKNLLYKVEHWTRNDFKVIIDKLSNSNDNILLIVNNTKLGKHEWIYLNVLRTLGINILVITKDFSYMNFADNVRFIKFATNENLTIGSNKNISTNNEKSKTVETVSKELYNIDKDLLKSEQFINIVKDHSENIKIAVYGTDIGLDTRVIAAKLKENCNENQNSFFIEEKISKPTLDETSKIYRITRDNVDYVIATLKNFVRCYDKNTESYVKDLLLEVLNGFKAKGDTSSIIYNKGTLLICWLNRYLKNKNATIVFYGKPYGNEEILLNILSKINDVNIIILSGNKQNTVFKFNQNNGINIELPNDDDNISIELVSTDTATTLAYNASKIVDQTLYGENTVGLYREGQIIGCDTKHLACTFDETVMWWNKEMFIRPGYKQYSNSVEIPVQFAIIRGMKGNENDYTKLVQRYCCGKTTIYRKNNFYPRYNRETKDGMYIHNCTDINGTLFSEQKPFIVGDKLQSKLIKNSRNFKYSFLDGNKQDFILSKIQEIIDDKMISKPYEYKNDKDKFYNMLLGITLNLDLEMIRTIQWFNYTDYNPNIVVISNDENTLTFEDIIYLRFLSKLGFDILIFVPTQYSSVEKFLNKSEYETYDIGRAEYSLDLSDIEVKKDADYVQKQTAEKKGWFSKFFN